MKVIYIYFEDGKDGEIIFYGDRFFLKMCPKRLVYMRHKNSEMWNCLNKVPAVPIGFSRDEKKHAIEEIYNAIEKNNVYDEEVKNE